MKFTKKDNLIIIGAGKISYSLAPAMIDAGYKIKSIISSQKKGRRS
jgi:Trk K+ transport system NAD-binding subunit